MVYVTSQMFLFLSVTMERPSASFSQRLRATLYREQAVDSHGALSVSSLKTDNLHVHSPKLPDSL